MSEKKPTKQELAVDKLKASYGCDLCQVIESNTKGFKAVIGYSKVNHVRLIDYTHRTKKHFVMKSTSELTFSEVVADVTKEIEVIEENKVEETENE